MLAMGRESYEAGRWNLKDLSDMMVAWWMISLSKRLPIVYISLTLSALL
jgi:hypothetical protein